jgi:hypothetical protein
MMNKAQTLTDAKAAKVAQFADFLNGHIGQQVSVNFRKRDGQGEGSGQFRTLVGECVEVKGAADKAVVIVSTDKGFRSANLSNILHAKVAD